MGDIRPVESVPVVVKVECHSASLLADKVEEVHAVHLVLADVVPIGKDERGLIAACLAKVRPCGIHEVTRVTAALVRPLGVLAELRTFAGDGALVDI